MNKDFVGVALAVFATAAALTGCVSLGDSSDTPAAVYYVLNDTAPAAAAPAVQPPTTVTTLRVLDTTTGSFYDTERLVFSRSADTRGHYQFARWTERPGKRFADLMRTRLDHQGIWNVSAGDGHVGADWLLDTELIEFYHDAPAIRGSCGWCCAPTWSTPGSANCWGAAYSNSKWRWRVTTPPVPRRHPARRSAACSTI